MTLRLKVLVLSALTVIGLVLVLATVARAVWYSSFDALELGRVEVDLRRVSAAVTDDIEQLDRTAADWADWDDTYAFVEDSNVAYRDSNLTPESLKTLALDVLAFFDASGRAMHVGALGRTTGEPVAVAPDLLAALSHANTGSADGACKGIIAYSDFAALAVRRPIRTSQRLGPQRGHVVMMRLLDEEAVSAIAARTHVPVALSRAAAAAGSPGGSPGGAASPAARNGAVFHGVEVLGESTIGGSVTIPDVSGRPEVTFRVVEPRSIHAEAANGLELLTVCLIVIGAVFGTLTVVILERLVCARLELLSSEARTVGSKQDFAMRVTVRGSDELAGTAAAINSMLASFEQSDLQRKASDAALRLCEENLQQARKMEAIGRLAGGVAHDFNSVLCVMMGHATLMADRLRDNPPLRHHANQIEQAADHAASLTQRLLAFSRKQAVVPKVIDLRLLIDENEDMLRRLVGTHIEIVRSSSRTLDSVFIDAGQITQALLNLLANARDAMPRGGSVRLDTSTVVFECETDGVPPGRWVRLSVADDGAGMDRETMERLFEPFFTTKRAGAGTGLGLASAHGAVIQAGGHIRVSSEVGRGTMFRVYLPAVAEASPAQNGRVAEPISTPIRETVLVVDDDESVRTVVCATLRSGGYDVVEADGPDEAIRLAQSAADHIGCLVTDVLMPKMRGPELASRVCAIRPDIAVVFISGCPDDADVLAAIAAGSSFLPKPFRSGELLRKVREAKRERNAAVARV